MRGGGGQGERGERGRERMERWSALQRLGPTPLAAGATGRAVQRGNDPMLVLAKQRFLCAASADSKGGQHSTGVRGWIIFCTWARNMSPVPDPLNMTPEHRSACETLLEDFAVWYAVCKPSGMQASYISIGKYVSSVRAWYRRFHRAELGYGFQGSRIKDILKGYAREIDQPPARERIGCTPAYMALGMARALAGVVREERG